jgi:hypothetical protein
VLTVHTRPKIKRTIEIQVKSKPKEEHKRDPKDFFIEIKHDLYNYGGHRPSSLTHSIKNKN